MARSRTRAAVLLAVLLTGAADAAAAPPGGPVRPRLVVILAADQMRADYVEWYGARWTQGLRRLFDSGAVFTHAEYPYLGTVTCPGHATIGTGTYPATHGLVSNTWWDGGRRAVVACADDPDKPLIGAQGPPGRQLGPGQGPAYLKGTTLADALRTGGGRVVALSMKARAAVTLAGHAGDVLWFGGGEWVTSTAYAKTLPAWAAAFIERTPLVSVLTEPWRKLRPDGEYLYVDEASWEAPPGPWTRSFPHPLALPAAPRETGLWEQSPAADRYLGELAREAVTRLDLGHGPGVDFLSVSFSALDRVGHAFGPRSHEVQDVLFRLDATIGSLLRTLDERVGPGKYIVAFTSDHGVAPPPEDKEGTGQQGGRIDPADVAAAVTAALRGALHTDAVVARVEYTDVYLQPAAAAAVRANAQLRAAAVAALRGLPGIAEAFSSADLDGWVPARDDMSPRALAARSHFAGRSGELVLLPKPFWLTVPRGTTHGTSNPYDRRVPLVLLGGGVKPGRYPRVVSPAMIARSLARVSGLDPNVALPRAEPPLSEALAKP